MKIRNLVLFLLLSCMLISCLDFESDKAILDETRGVVYNLYDVYTDNHGNKGIVVYIDHSDYTPLGYEYILIMSVDETKCAWGPMGELVGNDSVSNDDLTRFSYGIAIHQKMKAKGIDRYPAQAWCDKKNHNDIPYAGSWHLMNYSEWKKIRETMSVPKLNAAFQQAGGTKIEDANDKYWTCVEDYEGFMIFTDGTASDYYPEDRAVIQSFSGYSLINKNAWLKKYAYKVRAVKYIYYYDYL